MFSLQQPHHIPTLPEAAALAWGSRVRFTPESGRRSASGRGLIETILVVPTKEGRKQPLKSSRQIAETKCAHESPPVRGYSQ